MKRTEKAVVEPVVASEELVNTPQVEGIVVNGGEDVSSLAAVESAVIKNTPEAVVADDEVGEKVTLEDGAVAEVILVEDILDTNEEVENIKDPALEQASEDEFISSGPESLGKEELKATKYDLDDAEESSSECLVEIVFCTKQALENYLTSHKAEDKVVQESKGGNFVSIHSREIYIPLSLLTKK